MYTRKTINIETEKRILTGLIISTQFCREAVPLLRTDHFEVEYSRTILRWIRDYWQCYGKAPGVHIQDIFSEQRSKLRSEYADLISTFLQELSDRYTLDDDKRFNSDYLMDQFRHFAKSRSLLLLADDIKRSVSDGKLEEADTALDAHKIFAGETSKWINPFADGLFVDKVLDADNDFLFNFPGRLGDMVPSGYRRDWLVGVMGPMKRGKTFWLLEMAVQALLSKLRVVFVSLEMKDIRIGRRLFKRITSMGDKDGLYYFPVFDCARNQDGTCNRLERTNKIILLGEDGEKLSIDKAPRDYVPCVACRGREAFIPESWFVPAKREGLSFANLRKGLEGFASMTGANRNFRLKAYPAYSANLQDIRNDLRILEDAEGFVPDVVVIDYADILCPEDNKDEGRDRYDRTWKALKNLAGTMNNCVITATQSTRKTLDAKNVKSSDTSEDIRKFAHVDLMLGLNQMPGEKKQGRIRISVLGVRDEDFIQMRQVIVLQNLALAQTLLDSEFNTFVLDADK